MAKNAGSSARGVRRGHKLRQYDDRELVAELARGTPVPRIARRLGLCQAMVFKVRKGLRRADLHPRIVRSRQRLERRLLGQVRRRLAVIARGLAGRPGGVRMRNYDDAELVIELARGTVSLCEIARRTGLTPNMVSKIRQGIRRAELQPLIRELRGRTELTPLLPVRRVHKRKDYDDQELAMALAQGATPHEIAHRIGLSVRTICHIRKGRFRRDLQPAIRRERGRLDRRLLAGVRRAFLARTRRLLRLGLTNRPGASQAREALLDIVMQEENPHAEN